MTTTWRRSVNQSSFPLKRSCCFLLLLLCKVIVECIMICVWSINSSLLTCRRGPEAIHGSWSTALLSMEAAWKLCTGIWRIWTTQCCWSLRTWTKRFVFYGSVHDTLITKRPLSVRVPVVTLVVIVFRFLVLFHQTLLESVNTAMATGKPSCLGSTPSFRWE